MSIGQVWPSLIYSLPLLNEPHQWRAIKFLRVGSSVMASTPDFDFVWRNTKGLYAKFISMMSPKSSVIENDGELMLMAFHAHFLPQQQYCQVYALFCLFTLWFIDEDASFFHFFNKLTNIRSWRCLSSSKSNIAIFPSVVQPYSFSGIIQLIICEIRYELSVTIHEISTSWKKTLDGGPNMTYMHTSVIGHYNPSDRITINLLYSQGFRKKSAESKRVTEEIVFHISFCCRYPSRG